MSYVVGQDAFVTLARDMKKQFPCKVVAVEKDYVGVRIDHKFHNDHGIIVGTVRVYQPDTNSYLSPEAHRGRNVVRMK